MPTKPKAPTSDAKVVVACDEVRPVGGRSHAHALDPMMKVLQEIDTANVAGNGNSGVAANNRNNNRNPEIVRVKQAQVDVETGKNVFNIATNEKISPEDLTKLANKQRRDAKEQKNSLTKGIWDDLTPPPTLTR